MPRPFARLCLPIVLCLVAGCGGAGGIKPGIPDNVPAAPVNPTDDMTTPGAFKKPK